MLPFLLAACSDDKNFSPVEMTLTLDGVTQVNDNFYTVAGEDVSIESLTVKALDGKNTALANTFFYLNGTPLLGGPGNPFSGTFSTEGLEAGTYEIGITGNLLQEGVAIQNFIASYSLVIVESDEDLPENAPEIGTYSQSIQVGK